MSKKEVNEYLFYEFGMDGDLPDVSDDWPFRLQSVGSIRLEGAQVELYEFSAEGTDYYAYQGFYFPRAGMTLDDLSLQDIGRQWITSQHPVGLETTVIGDERVPPMKERRQMIETLAKNAVGDSREFVILEGLFLRETQSYLALLEIENSDEAVVVGTGLPSISVGFSEATPFGRLSYALGKRIQSGASK